ncbi:hybrid sensor histidine kinase/response regulator [Pseudoalteromonas sp. MMG022]|uniref:sensor histidine kinase n=1 Tax=Pseudoalteromonas sp. MMG022 TaxID=2909978 RepID=UPI001F35ED01|nr:hybrid sensor histidine kinase/response regulator [Pseudoalteromonas sp. MMG022]MCF6436269.1 hybrid sensor histidine kinase/response regulator [Pseudoalteromonas sp. MMG022]
MNDDLASLNNCKILIVDDKAENLELLTGFLEAQGYEVAFATSGKEAINIATIFLPHLILLDVMMPGIDGFETCRRLKSLDKVKDVPVIFVTGKAELSDIVEAFNVGAVDYVTKPIRQEELLARVSTHLQLQALINLRDELISTLRDKTLELEKLSKLKEQQLEASQQFSHLGELVGELTHELGTPLSVISTAITHLDDKQRELNQKVQQQTLAKSDLQAFIDNSAQSYDIVLSNLSNAMNLINSFKHIVVGEFSGAITEFNLLDYLYDIQRVLHPKLKRLPHEVQITCPTALQITSDAGALSQILINLINNALIHAFSQSTAGHIYIDVSHQNQQITLSIKDDGRGMDTDRLNKIFDKYFSTRIGQGGSGLGLYIVKNLVEKSLQGHIEVSSQIGKGTHFCITLPQHMAVHEQS